MPRRKKQARELTTEEMAKRLFPKKVRDEVKKEANSESESTIKKNGSTA